MLMHLLRIKMPNPVPVDAENARNGLITAMRGESPKILPQIIATDKSMFSYPNVDYYYGR